MSALRGLISAEIDAGGPMRLDRYMALCLGHPQHGYYPTRDPLGAAGDFVTAPEISQMFGELVGLWLAQVWIDAGRPDPFVLAEAGPGRGTLMADILRATRQVPGLHGAARLWLIETSPALRARQAQALSGAGPAPAWVDRIEDLPPGSLLLVANEFFDALPIRQFRRSAEGWHELAVALAQRVAEGAAPGALRPGYGPATANPALDARFGPCAPGTIVETCPEAEQIAARIGARIAALGGAALLVDYGDWQGTGDTFQALRDHTPVSPFDAPGSADLTAHVQFAPLAAASGLRPQFAPQGAFLERLGITARAQALARATAQPGTADAVAAAHRRLTHPGEMGMLFKVLGLSRPDAPPLPGFA